MAMHLLKILPSSNACHLMRPLGKYSPAKTMLRAWKKVEDVQQQDAVRILTESDLQDKKDSKWTKNQKWP